MVIRELRLGCAVDMVNEAEDLPALISYLKEQWRRKAAGQPLDYNPDRDGIRRFDHDNIAKQFETLIHS